MSLVPSAGWGAFRTPFWTPEQRRLDMKALSFTVAKPGVVALALIADVAFSIPARAADPAALIGNWKLVSWQVVVGDETQNPFGSHPKGFLILTREGRAM